jgi:thiamine biosynthesis lipoprotein
LEPIAQPNRLQPPLAPPDTPHIPAGMSRIAFRAMGTTIECMLPEAQAQEGAEIVRALFARWEQTLSRFLPESELCYLNRHAGETVSVSPLLFTVVRTALAAAYATGGLYDPTLLKQIIWLGYDRTFDDIPPLVAVVDTPGQPGGDWRAIQLEQKRRAITLPAGVGIDVGGIAKGMAVDAALNALHREGINTALVNAGGDLAIRGTPPTSNYWSVAIEGKDQSRIIALWSGSLATSGVGRRRWQQGDITRHHIIDPRTGESAQSGLWSVTVAATRCRQAEIAAKVAFILGAKQGIAFLQQHALAGLLTLEDGRGIATDNWPAMTGNSGRERKIQV